MDICTAWRLYVVHFALRYTDIAQIREKIRREIDCTCGDERACRLLLYLILIELILFKLVLLFLAVEFTFFIFVKFFVVKLAFFFAVHLDIRTKYGIGHLPSNDSPAICRPHAHPHTRFFVAYARGSTNWLLQDHYFDFVT